MRYSTGVGLGILALIAAVQGGVRRSAPARGFDAVIDDNAQRLLREGRQIFRYDTFGDEAFWGDALHLHRAIAGERNGGGGAGGGPQTPPPGGPPGGFGRPPPPPPRR